jgi:DNA-directed RNA polymerase I, II, and III subunit RPABC2
MFNKHTMDDDYYQESEEEYEEESDVEEDIEEEIAEDNLDDDIEKEEEEEIDDEEPAEDDDDMNEYFESSIIPTYDEKDTKTFLSTIEEITNQTAKHRRTLSILNKYEKAKIIGIRAQQISMGSFIYLEDLKGLSNPLDIAKEELRQKRTPLIVRRSMLGKKGVIHEDWRIEELIDPHEDL